MNGVTGNSGVNGLKVDVKSRNPLCVINAYTGQDIDISEQAINGFPPVTDDYGENHKRIRMMYVPLSMLLALHWISDLLYYLNNDLVLGMNQLVVGPVV